MSVERDLVIEEYQRTGNLELRNKLLEENADFIKKQVGYLCFDTRFKKDFEQEGIIGFIDALDRYKKGGNFNACMFWGIKKRVLDFYRKSKSSVKTTTNYDMLLSKVRKYKAKYSEKNGGCEMSDEDLSLVLTRKEMHVWELSQAESFGVDYLENLKEYSVNESIDRESLEELSANKERLKAVLREMSEDERWLIKSRYGIGTEKQNLSQIGFFLKKTPQRVEQMQKAIERKIKQRLNLANTLHGNVAIPSPRTRRV